MCYFILKVNIIVAFLNRFTVKSKSQNNFHKCNRNIYDAKNAAQKILN